MPLKVTQTQLKDETVVKLEGMIDEHAVLPEGFDSVIRLDLEKVTGMNSIGIRHFILWTDKFKTLKMILEKCQPIFVRNFNYVLHFHRPNMLIESFYVPYYSEATDERVNLVLEFSGSLEKPSLIESLDVFLDQDQGTFNIKELCIQSADEMITNAIFNAPVNTAGQRLNSAMARNSDVSMPGGKKGRFFASTSGNRAIVGSEDPFGSLQRQTVLERLEQIYDHTVVSPKIGAGGAGLGLKYMIDNSANFYLYCEYGKKTVIACAFMLKGMKSNTSPIKHFHISTG
jgi:hypothetical protein